MTAIGEPIFPRFEKSCVLLLIRFLNISIYFDHVGQYIAIKRKLENGLDPQFNAVGAWIRWGLKGQKRSRLKTARRWLSFSHDPGEVLGIDTAKKRE